MALSPPEEIIVADETNTTTTTSTTTTQPAKSESSPAKTKAEPVEPAAPAAPAKSPEQADAPEVETETEAEAGTEAAVISYEPKVDGTGNAEAERVAELYRSTVDEETGAMTGSSAVRRKGLPRLGRVGEPHFANPDTRQQEKLPANQQTTVENSGLVAPPSVDRTPAEADTAAANG